MTRSTCCERCWLQLCVCGPLAQHCSSSSCVGSYGVRRARTMLLGVLNLLMHGNQGHVLCPTHRNAFPPLSFCVPWEGSAVLLQTRCDQEPFPALPRLEGLGKKGGKPAPRNGVGGEVPLAGDELEAALSSPSLTSSPYQRCCIIPSG